ncbi:hypothetical protein [Actinoplanes sp. NBRC 103695]|uniref:LppU/SCO3897 family protein n=1 Tax=Actinoplanes sp. NBRC 103695 TaxID=3032202 RepID=UPI0024A5C6A3|nr:hypothetical protein [Actinoplanes sp. NBRC 103695]GLZ01491.1 hypothetical protein Acsp02_87420 [Actinoplanes sp. NBRC 103695]
MTQNGPFPGPPSQPWSNRGSSDEPYTEPADPWGDHPTANAPNGGWGHHPTSVPPAADTGFSTVGPQPNFAAPPPQPAWGHQPTQQPRKRNTPIVALVIVLGLLICGGLGTTAWLLSGRGDDDARGVTPAPSATSTADEITDPQPRSSEDARFVSKGQCVRNEGTAAKPEMKIVACASGTFEVLKRVDGRTSGESDAESKCNRVPEYTKWYFYDSELDSLDFVLCLKER